ncbi:MAG: SH3 domain-containing protein [Anaerolineae bacterium]|nr:SH3 domain-containing protein [Anaerolineae bacterium]
MRCSVRSFISLSLIWTTSPTEAQVLGTGWTGTFYAGTIPGQGTPLAQNVSFPGGICFNWQNGPPTQNGTEQCQNGATIPNVPADNFSAIFTTTQTFSVTGNYTFTLKANDAIRLKVNNVTYIDQFVQVPDDNERTYAASVPITAGVATIIVVEYAEFVGAAKIQVQWLVPSSGGTSPTATTPPPATGAVIRVRGLAIRTGPYLGASLIGVAVPNTSYPISARNNDEGLFVWYRITAGDRTGWVSGRYFQVTGNIEAVPFNGTNFDNIDNAPDIGVRGVTRAIMNFRRRPSERSNLIGKIPWGAEVTIVGRTLQGGRNFWLQVRYDNKIGWIYAPFIGISGGLIDAVPVH